MRFNLLKKRAVRAISLITALSCFASVATISVSAEDGDVVYAYNFEDDKSPTLADGGVESSVAEGYDDNSSKVIKIEKTSTGTAAADNRVQIYPLGDEIAIANTDGSAKYIRADFKIFVDGDGFESVAVGQDTQKEMTKRISVKDSGEGDIEALEAGKWNEVSVIFTIGAGTGGSTKKYPVTSDIYVNGTAVAQSSAVTVNQSKNKNDCFWIRLFLFSDSGKTFTAYMDDLSLTTYSVYAPELKETGSCTVDNDNYIVTVEEGTTVGELEAADGCDITAYNGDEELEDGDVLASGNTVVVINSLNIKNTYRVKIEGEDYKPTAINSYDFEDGETGLDATNASIAAVAAPAGNSSAYAAEIVKKADTENAVVSVIGQNVPCTNAGEERYFKLSYKIYADDEGFEYIAPVNEQGDIAAAPLSVINGNSSTSDSKELLKAGEWNNVVYVLRYTNSSNGTYDVVYDIYVNKKLYASSTLKGVANTGEEGKVSVNLALASASSEAFTVYLDDIKLETYGTDPVIKPELVSGSSYKVSDGYITLSKATSADDLTAENADSIKVYTNTSLAEELSSYDALSAGCAVVVENEEVKVMYAVSKDSDTINYQDFESFDAVANKNFFTNATSAVPIETVAGVGGKDADDLSLRVDADCKNATSNPSCKTYVTTKQPLENYYKVDFNIMPTDSKFVSVGLGDGWTMPMTTMLTVGSSTSSADCIKVGEWNHVTFIIYAGPLYDYNPSVTAGRYRMNVTSKAYINGSLVSEETIANRVPQAGGSDAIFPIAIMMTQQNADDTFVVYIDDIVVSTAKSEATLTSSLNKLSDKNGHPVTPTDTVITLKSNYELESSSVVSDNILLNGKKLASGQFEMTKAGKNTVLLKLKGLNSGEVYNLSAGSENWSDVYGRSLAATDITFETEGAVTIGSLKVSSNSLTEGSITATASALKNNTASSQNATVIMTLMKDGKLVACTASETVAISANETLGSLECTIDVPDVSDGEYVLNCFLWDSLTGGVSYRGHLEITE